MNMRTKVIEGEYQGCAARVLGRGYTVSYEGGKRTPYKTLTLIIQASEGVSTHRTLPASHVQNGYALHASFGKVTQ